MLVLRLIQIERRYLCGIIFLNSVRCTIVKMRVVGKHLVSCRPSSRNLERVSIEGVGRTIKSVDQIEGGNIAEIHTSSEVCMCSRENET